MSWRCRPGFSGLILTASRCWRFSMSWSRGSGSGSGCIKRMDVGRPNGINARANSHVYYRGMGYRGMRSKLNRRGFTLIELLIVMAIILVIAAIAVPQLGKQLMAAHENATIQTLGHLN